MSTVEDSNVTLESEPGLIARAQMSVSQCNWTVGECAAVWTKRFARGRTDADFAVLVGLSPDQIFQRRRVWETFGDVAGQYANLKWSHFYTALNWDDAAECLQWAEEIQATVAEMKAWRRAQRGEDLSQPGEDETFSWLPTEPTPVRAPEGEGEGRPGGGGGGEGSDADPEARMAGSVARQADGEGGYAPFSGDAMKVPGSPSGDGERAELTPEQIVKKLTGALERCAGMLTDSLREEFDDLSEKTRKRFFKALETLNEKAADFE